MKKVNLFVTNIIDAGAAFGLLPNGDSAFIPKGIVDRVGIKDGRTYRAAVVANKNEDVIDRTPWFAVYVGEEAPDDMNDYSDIDEPAHPRTADVDTTPMAGPEPEPEFIPLHEEVRTLLLDGRVWSIGSLFRAIYGEEVGKKDLPEEYNEVVLEMRKTITEGKLHKGQVYTAGAELAGFDFFSTDRAALMPQGDTP